MTCSVTSLAAEPSLKTNRSIINLNTTRKNSQDMVKSIKNVESKKTLIVDK